MLLRTAAIVAAVAVLVGVSLPPARITTETSFDDGTIAGVVHVHTNRSDGRSAPDDIAAAAARAGLSFVVFTDHGDGIRAPDPPVYRNGVLCIDAVEISTSHGHLLALGLPAAPFPLGGEARDVLDDIHRLGGFAVAAHPDSPKPELAWREWPSAIDGIELVNLDTTWRARVARAGWRSKLTLLQSVLAYPFRPSEAIAALVDDNPALVERWLALAAERSVPFVGSSDAHARLGFGDDEPRGTGFALALPSYGAVFNTLSQRIRPARALTGDAAEDARLVLEAVRAGRGYLSLDGVATPPSFSFSATNATGSVEQGGTLPVDGPLTLTVRSSAPATFTTTIYHDLTPLASRPAHETLELSDQARPGVYRAEVRATDRNDPPVWIASNPIYVRAGRESPHGGTAPRARLEGEPGLVLFNARTTGTWRTEASPTAVIAFEAATTASSARELRVRWGLPGGTVSSPYAALVTETANGVAGFDRLVFTARAERPMRLSVQVRVTLTTDRVNRWVRSVYLDGSTATQTVYFDDLTPVEPVSAPIDLSNAHSIIFSVDTTNTAPGTSGRFWLTDVTLARPSAASRRSVKF